MDNINKYPCVCFDSKKLAENIRSLINFCGNYNCNPMFVTKGICANEKVIKLAYENGVRWVGDSRILNLKKIDSMGYKFDKKVLLRIPMKSELKEVIEHSDISFQSEFKTIEILSEIAISKKITHSIVLLIEQGDLREGILEKNIHDLVVAIKSLKNIKLVGIGSNLTCLNGVLPSKQTIEELECIYSDLQNKGNKCKILSYGNSSMINYLRDTSNELRCIKNIRLGESFLMGIDTATRQPLQWLNQDIFTFSAQIIELKEKPSKPWGEISFDGYGNRVEQEDLGKRIRAILGFGKQDVNMEYIKPKDKSLNLIGQNSDHTVIDVTNSVYALGDRVEFSVNYQGLLMCMTSEYVYKSF